MDAHQALLSLIHCFLQGERAELKLVAKSSVPEENFALLSTFDEKRERRAVCVPVEGHVPCS